ncbi:MAG: terminase B [Alphaproteobacteria bacterium]|nr:terminase B [Alphaproteobacteria bacterium]
MRDDLRERAAGKADPAIPMPAAPLSAALARQTLRRWRREPARFVTEVFDVAPEPWQLAALTAIADHDRLAIRSGHGVGKSALLAWLVLWWLTTRYPAKVPCTAPSGHQLQDVLWGEIGCWARRMPEPLRAHFDIKRDRVDLADGGQSFAVARTARKEHPEAFQGFHADHLLFVVDEASGVADPIFEAGQGAMSTAGAKTVMAGNPTRNSGYFHDAFHGLRHLWVTMKVGCADSRLVDPAYIAEVADKYGAESNVYRVRVLGEFPRSEDDVVIPLHLVEEAVKRDVEGFGPVAWGLDVARFGSDRSALCKRHGNQVPDPIRAWRQKDTMQVAGLVAAEFRETRPAERPARIVVDAIGLGAGVADRLRELGLPAVALNVAEAAAEGERYQRLRDELWFRARDWFQRRECRLAADPALIGELSRVRYAITSSGRIKVESKDEMKRRGMASPDLADAFVLTFAGGGNARLAATPAYADAAYDPFDGPPAADDF